MKNIGLLRLLVSHARLAQLVERQPFKLVVVGSSPTVGVSFIYFSRFASRLKCRRTCGIAEMALCPSG